jgi:hypothetical protein
MTTLTNGSSSSSSTTVKKLSSLMPSSLNFLSRFSVSSGSYRMPTSLLMEISFSPYPRWTLTKSSTRLLRVALEKST